MSGKFPCHCCAEFFDSGSNLQKHFSSVHGQVSQKAHPPKLTLPLQLLMTFLLSLPPICLHSHKPVLMKSDK